MEPRDQVRETIPFRLRVDAAVREHVVSDRQLQIRRTGVGGAPAVAPEVAVGGEPDVLLLGVRQARGLEAGHEGVVPLPGHDVGLPRTRPRTVHDDDAHRAPLPDDAPSYAAWSDRAAVGTIAGRG